MASDLIMYLRLMIQAYLYDGAYQSEDESQPYSLESTTVLEGFRELVHGLAGRIGRDEEIQSRVEKATEESANHLNATILLNTNDLKCEDDRLLEESAELIKPSPRRSALLSDKEAVRELLDAQKRSYEERQEEANKWGIGVEDLPRWNALWEASYQGPHVLLLKYMLVMISKCRTAELHRDMLKINDLHKNERYGLKRTICEAFLCRVFGFDQGAASLCGAAIENEAKDRLTDLGFIQLRSENWPFGTDKSTFPGRQMTAKDLIAEAHTQGLLGNDTVQASEALQKGEHVLDLRNSALHRPQEFNKMLKLDRYERFVPDTRDVLEALQGK